MKKEELHTLEEYKVICKVLGIVILIIGILWYTSDNKRLKWINELKTTISEYEQKIEELEEENKSMEEVIASYDLY